MRETHGRWPLVAATAVAPVSVVAVRRPGLRPLAALLWHQTEEWVWPGGFLPWINRDLFGAEEDEFPIDRRAGFVINVVIGWGASLVVATGGARSAGPAALLYSSHVANAAMHLGWAARHRRYDPGAVTSVATLLPASVAGTRRLLRDPAVSRRVLSVGAGLGAVASATLPIAMRRRVRRRAT